MSKSAKRIVDDYKQMSLLELLQVEQEELTSKRAGRMCVSAKLIERGLGVMSHGILPFLDG